MSADFVGDGPERHSSEPSHELTHGQRWPFRGNSWPTSPPRPDRIEIKSINKEGVQVHGPRCHAA
jgi:hypothetical protein